MLAVWGRLGLKLGLVGQLTLPATGLLRKQDLEAKKVEIHICISQSYFLNMYFMC